MQHQLLLTVGACTRVTVVVSHAYVALNVAPIIRLAFGIDRYLASSALSAIDMFYRTRYLLRTYVHNEHVMFASRVKCDICVTTALCVCDTLIVVACCLWKRQEGRGGMCRTISPLLKMQSLHSDSTQVCGMPNLSSEVSRKDTNSWPYRMANSVQHLKSKHTDVYQ